MAAASRPGQLWRNSGSLTALLSYLDQRSSALRPTVRHTLKWLAQKTLIQIRRGSLFSRKAVLCQCVSQQCYSSCQMLCALYRCTLLSRKSLGVTNISSLQNTVTCSKIISFYFLRSYTPCNSFKVSPVSHLTELDSLFVCRT